MSAVAAPPAATVPEAAARRASTLLYPLDAKADEHRTKLEGVMNDALARSPRFDAPSEPNLESSA